MPLQLWGKRPDKDPLEVGKASIRKVESVPQVGELHPVEAKQRHVARAHRRIDGLHDITLPGSGVGAEGNDGDNVVAHECVFSVDYHNLSVEKKELSSRFFKCTTCSGSGLDRARS